MAAYHLFPALVALWFAGVFALGSLAVEVSLLERAVLALGLDQVIAAAAPPLGLTARVLLALAMAAVGGVLGIVVAALFTRRDRPATQWQKPVAATKPQVRTRDSHPDAPPRRPISAFEEFDDEPLESLSASPNRIRNDAPPVTAEAIDEVIERAPVAPPRFAPPPSARNERRSLIEMFGLGEAQASEPPPQPPAAESMPPVAEPAPVTYPAEEPEPAASAEPLDPPCESPAPPASAADKLRTAPLDALSHVELIERLAIGLQRRREEAVAAALARETEPATPLARITPSGETGEDQPVMIFPAHSARRAPFAAPGDETGRRLREALASLRRVGNAG